MVTIGYLLLVPTNVLAAPPTILSYQGRLTNASGSLLGGSSGTTYYFKFSIWSALSGGTKLWPTSDPTSYGVTVREGVFNVNIGDTANGYPDTLDYSFSSANVFLKVEVSSNNVSFETLSPRQQITSSAFAQVAGAVSGAAYPSSFGTTTPFGTSVVSIEATSTQSTGLTIRGFSSQIANLFQIQNSSGTNLFVVDSGGSVGVGTTTATRKFNVLDANSVPQFRLSQASGVYSEFYVDSTGDLRLSATGGNIRQNDENLWVCSGGSCGATAPSSKGNLIVETAVIFDNNFKLKQIDASTTIMYDTTNTSVLEFDEGQ
jgi:hypothetical protein